MIVGDLGSLVAEPPFDIEIGVKQFGVVLQLALTTQLSMKLLASVIMSVASMRIEHVPALVGQDRRTFVGIDVDGKRIKPSSAR